MDATTKLARTPYERTKTLQQERILELGRKPPIKDLLVLGSNNDPFYAGRGISGSMPSGLPWSSGTARACT